MVESGIIAGMQDMLETKVSEALKALGVEAQEPVIEFPAELAHGDYATNAALAGAKAAGMNPRKLAEKIVEKLGDIEHVEKIDIAGPGFINFHLAREYFSNTVANIDENFGKNKSARGEKIGIEYYQPNYFKALHVGHLMNAMIGESLARLAEFSGADVARIAYYADIGPHIAKAIWGIRDLDIDPKTPEDLSRAYEHGTAAYKNDESVKDVIDAINQSVYARR